MEVTRQKGTYVLYHNTNKMCTAYRKRSNKYYCIFGYYIPMCHNSSPPLSLVVWSRAIVSGYYRQYSCNMRCVHVVSGDPQSCLVCHSTV